MNYPLCKTSAKTTGNLWASSALPYRMIIRLPSWFPRSLSIGAVPALYLPSALKSQQFLVSLFAFVSIYYPRNNFSSNSGNVFSSCFSKQLTRVIFTQCICLGSIGLLYFLTRNVYDMCTSKVAKQPTLPLVAKQLSSLPLEVLLEVWNAHRFWFFCG